jgi:hypothetical protein
VTFGHAEVVLWSLRKGEHRARAELRLIEGSEDELRLVMMGKRELEAMGWRRREHTRL